VQLNNPRPWPRRLGTLACAAALAAAPLALGVAPAQAGTTGVLMYSTDGGATWSSTAMAAPGRQVLVRAWYDNEDPRAHTGSSIVVTLPAGYRRVAGSTRACLNPSTKAGAEATPDDTELVCDTSPGQGGPIDEHAVWAGSTLTVSPTAGLFGQPTGTTVGFMAMGKKRYLDLVQCGYQTPRAGVPGADTTAQLIGQIGSRGNAVARTDASDMPVDAAAACGSGQGRTATLAQNTYAESLDLLGRRYLNLDQCGYRTGADTTSIWIAPPGAFGTGTGTSNTPATPAPVCGPGKGTVTPFAPDDAALALDMLVNRYLNLQQCGYVTGAGGPDADTVIDALGSPPFATGTNAGEFPVSAPSCGAGDAATVPVAADDRALALDTLDTTRGAGYVQFAMTAPDTCATDVVSAQRATVVGAGLRPVTATGALFIDTSACA
jgi:hypothetical protein